MKDAAARVTATRKYCGPEHLVLEYSGFGLPRRKSCNRTCSIIQSLVRKSVVCFEAFR
jgi:hypothetical protein